MSCVIGAATPSFGQRLEAAKANRVKVAYLYNFTRYVEWPNEAFHDDKTPFVIGVLGSDPFGRSLDKIAKKRYQSTRPIAIERYESWSRDSLCHVLFLASSVNPEERQRAIAESRNSPILIVSDVGLNGTLPAPLNLYLDNDGTIGFEINVTETRLRKLKVSAKLLKLARVVGASTGASQAALDRRDALGPTVSAASRLIGVSALLFAGVGR